MFIVFPQFSPRVDRASQVNQKFFQVDRADRRLNGPLSRCWKTPSQSPLLGMINYRVQLLQQMINDQMHIDPYKECNCLLFCQE